MFRRNFLASDPNNHSLVGNPPAGRLRRLIRVQMEKFNCDPKKMFT
ncbi:MAG: hypothetical protein LBT09_06785 [Planctomycetaceae bacterium]|nr:hypothetical protein [Planctomycetaceae bacterium]